MKQVIKQKMNIVPQFGLGTFRLTGGTVIESVKTALGLVEN